MDNAKMAADAYKLRKMIEAEVIEVEDSNIKITIGGDLKIKNISINNLEDDNLKDIINLAIRKVQEMQVMKMKEIMDLENIT